MSLQNITYVYLNAGGVEMEKRNVTISDEEDLEQYQLLFENARDIILFIRPNDGRILKANRAAAAAYGYDGPELLNLSIRDLRDQTQNSPDILLHQLDLADTQGILFETVHRRKDGSAFPVEVSSRGAQMAGGRVLLSIIRDITKRKELELSLKKQRQHLEWQVNERTNNLKTINTSLEQEIKLRKESEEKFFKSFRASPCHMLIIEFNTGLIIDANDSFLHTLGHSLSSILGRTTKEINLWVNPLEKKTIIKEVNEKGSIRNREVSFYTKSSKIRIGLFSAETIIINEEKCLLVVINDITERKMAEINLDAERRRLYNLLNELPIYVYIQAPDYSIPFANLHFRQHFGEVKDRACYEILLRRNEACDPCPALKVIKTNRPTNWEWRRSEEESYRVYSFPFSDINGSPLVLMLVVDITEQRQMEREMARLERLNIVGEMAASIGHEIRNPMTCVRGLLQILTGKDECAPYREHFNIMIGELDRANSIITEYLSLAKDKAVNKRPTSLNAILQAMYPLITDDALITDKTVNIVLEDVPLLMLDEKEIQQLLLNLTRNGLEAMSPGGTLTLRTYREGKAVVLEVEDQGTGIAPRVMEKLGTPFITTKDNGTGLGLAVCYQIAARNKASIKVKTGPSGTVFFIAFRQGLCETVKNEEITFTQQTLALDL